MTLFEAIQNAIAGGWDATNMPAQRTAIRPELLLDPKWWQALGKSMRWNEKTKHYLTYGDNSEFEKKGYGVPMDEWQYRWHQFIDHLAHGETVESFFEKL